MSERKLATVQHIKSLRPVTGLDRLELASISGWEVLIPKGQFHVNQKIVFFEPDSLISNDYGVPLKKDSTTGLFRVTASTVRGTHTQGLVVTLEQAGVDPDTPEGINLSDQLHVVKYVSPLELAANAGDVIGPYRSYFAPQTDATRIQNFADIYPEITQMRWEATVKADGTSRTVANDHGTMRFFTRNKEINPTLLLIEVSPMKQLEELGEGWAVQFELCGPKIQRNPLRLAGLTGYVFSVTHNGKFVPKKEWDHQFPNTVKDVEWEWPDTIEQAIQQVDGINSNYTPGRMDEGIVFYLSNGQDRPDWLDDNRRIKIINPSYSQKG